MHDPAVIEKGAHDGYQLHELREDEHLVPKLKHLRYHAIEQLELARGHVDPLWILYGVLLEELVRVIGDLSKLHHRVAQTLISDPTRGGIPSQSSIEDAVVDNFLPIGQFNFDDLLDLGRQLLFYLTFYTPEQERSKHLMQPVDD